MSLSVSDAPEILTSSHCVKIISQIRCSCNSQGNPLPSLVWEIAGEPVNHSADIPIREVHLGSGGMRSVITLYRLDEDMTSLVCFSINSLGSDSFVFNVSSSQTQLGKKNHQHDTLSLFGLALLTHMVCVDLSGLHTMSLLVGSAVGALVMLMVCVPLLLFFCR